MKLLNEEKAMELFMSGDIFGLEEMKKQLEEMQKQGTEINGDIMQILEYAMAVNYLVVETEQEKYASDYNGNARNLYEQVLADIFKILEIDIDYYWNR